MERSEEAVDRAVDPTSAVVAHALLNSLGVIGGAAATLKVRDASLPEATRNELYESILRQVEFIRGVLGDMARGLPSVFFDTPPN